ncbi:MAG: polysaccharide pyruvyl transferase family protein [Clostridia bacterium]|nr:polysaccharide pyruvyl transferase family protein [Clostridia bacterium]
MRIGIMSMQRVRNYGSFLQAFGLKSLLEQQGHEVSFVDIQPAPPARPTGRLSRFTHRLGKVDKYLFKRIRFNKTRKENARMFQEVQGTLLKLGPYATAEGCDAVVIGSDEIFTCDPKGPWQITAERFGDVPCSRVISYAASCGYTGVEDICPAHQPLIQQGLARLSACSVRDENTAHFVEEIRGGEVLRHLDPVLIYGFEEELRRGEERGIPAEPYMVVYAYHGRIHHPAEIRAIRAYAKQHRLKTVAIGGLLPWCDTYVSLTPFEVLAYFRHAACVVTDTFHGTVLSAKYNKPVGVLVRPSNANKLEDLLRRLHIQDHAVRQPADLATVLDEVRDYTAFNQRVAEERERTLEYLQTALS